MKAIMPQRNEAMVNTMKPRLNILLLPYISIFMLPLLYRKGRKNGKQNGKGSKKSTKLIADTKAVAVIV